jgi:uncharacterized DUF497 family protein
MDNEGKHGVSFAEAIEVFRDPDAAERFDEAHSLTEDRYLIIGLSKRGLLTVVYAEKRSDVYRIISAWKATRREKRIYEGKE